MILSSVAILRKSCSLSNRMSTSDLIYFPCLFQGKDFGVDCTDSWLLLSTFFLSRAQRILVRHDYKVSTIVLPSKTTVQQGPGASTISAKILPSKPKCEIITNTYGKPSEQHFFKRWTQRMNSTFSKGGTQPMNSSFPNGGT